MSTTVWLVTVPNNKENAKTTFTVISNELRAACELFRFKVPNLTVGTLDTLIALSDDLSKISQQVEVSSVFFETGSYIDLSSCRTLSEKSKGNTQKSPVTRPNLLLSMMSL
jgi:hypothetical protein